MATCLAIVLSFAVAGPAAADGRLFVLQKYAETLSVYDPDTGLRTQGAVRVAPLPHEMAATADGHELFVTNYGVKTFRDAEPGGNTLTVIDARRIVAAGFVDLGPYRRPHGIARGASGRFYVTTDQPPALLIIDPVARARVAEVPLAQALPHMVAVTPDEKLAVVACSGAGTLALVALPDPASSKAPSRGRARVWPVKIGGTPMGVVTSDDGRLAYVANRDGNQVVVVDLRRRRVQRTFSVPGEPARLALLPNRNQLLVGAIEGGAVVVLELRAGKELARVVVGHRPEGLWVDVPGDRVFVSAQDDNRVVRLRLSDWSITGAIETAEHPDAMWFDPSPEPANKPRAEGHATPLLEPARLASLGPAQREAWARYLERSGAHRAADRAVIDAELAKLGRTRMTPAPFTHHFKMDASMTADWFRGESGRRMVDAVLSFQTPTGGWSKHVHVTGRARQPGESFYSENEGWSYIATIDNDSTTEQMRFLAAAFAATGDVRAHDGFLRGVGYLLEAQFPNGGWPQVYPLQGGYHDAITINDNAMVNVLQLLGEVAANRFADLPGPLRQRAATAVARGDACLAAMQVVQDDVRTIWAQQHDPLTLAPVAARSYELAGLAGRESTGIVAYLMNQPSPTLATIAAVEGAIAWLRAHAVTGHDYNVRKGLTDWAPGATGPLLWARLYEPDSGRPIFSNRDGRMLYEWNQLTDRRFGYTWFTKDPAAVIASYDDWVRRVRRAPLQGLPRVGTAVPASPAP